MAARRSISHTFLQGGSKITLHDPAWQWRKPEKIAALKEKKIQNLFRM